MKVVAMVVVSALLAASFLRPQSTEVFQRGGGNVGDKAAIRQAIANWDAGWKEFNAELASQDYADDADWTNAFGRSRKGKAEIQKFLVGVFARPEMRSRRTTPSTVSIRFPRPDVAVVSSTRETVGQKTVGGQEYPTRKTHDLRVFVREGDRWAIVSHLIMDEKEVRP